MALSSSSMFNTASNLDLVRIAREMAEQKGLQFNDILHIVEDGIKLVAQKQFGKEQIKVEVNPFSGEISVMKGMKVIKDRDDYDADDGYVHVLLEDAKSEKPDAMPGDVFYIPVEGMRFGRMHMQTVRRHITGMISAIERDKQYREYINRVGDIVIGLVRRVEHNNIIVEHNNNELTLPVNQLIGSEYFRTGDRIKASIDKVRRVDNGPQVLLSRSANSFLAALMRQDIPEIYDGIITIKSIARIPGVRAKVAVYSSDPNVDPVGSCIGRRGIRINNISKELCGEKIDVILYSSDLTVFTANALVPAEISRVLVDEAAKKVEVVCPESKLNLAIGKDGANVKLASRLIGWPIEVMSEDTEAKKRVDEFNQLTSTLSKALDVEDLIAQLLVAEGYGSVEEIACSSVASLARINGFNEELAAQLIERGIRYVSEARERLSRETSLEAVLVDYPELYDALVKGHIETLQDFADLAIDDVTDIVGSISSFNIDEKSVGDLILYARKIGGMFDVDDSGS